MPAITDKTVRLVYIGDHFYHESKSLMSPIYTEDGARYDWGFVNVSLCAGQEVHIRPASNIELKHYQARLDMLKLGFQS